MLDNTIYNQSYNQVMVRADNNKIFIICHKEDQMQTVINRMTTDNCYLDAYEEWDEHDDMKWILTFQVIDGNETKPNMS